MHEHGKRNDRVIVAIAMVKNEEDIIECFCRYTLGFCEKLLIYEDNSDDKTPGILQSLIDEGLQIILIPRKFSLGFYKLEAINELAKLALEQYGADLVIPLDADEFLTTDENDTVRHILEELSDEIIYRFRWRTYVLTEDAIEREGAIFERFDKYRPIELETHPKVIASRKLLVEDHYSITLGQHLLAPSEDSPDREIVISDSLFFAHYPIRSLEQINTKIIVGWLNYLCMPEHREKSWHWPIMYETIKNAGGLTKKQAEEYSVFYSYFGEKTNINENNYQDKLITKRVDPGAVINNKKFELKYTPAADAKDIKTEIILSHIEKMIQGFDQEKIRMLTGFEIEKSKMFNEFGQERYKMLKEFETEKNDETGQAIERLKSTGSWKAGRFVTLPVRALKKIRSGKKARSDDRVESGIHDIDANVALHQFDSATEFMEFLSSSDAQKHRLAQEKLWGDKIPGRDECGLDNKQRLVLAVVNGIYEIMRENMGRIYVAEQATPFFEMLSGRFENVTGSENGMRREDCMDLSLRSESINCIIFNDVFEHVPDIHLALKEACRVLAPEGKMIFTTPCDFLAYDTIVRAGTENGQTVHYEFGRDMFDFLKQAGFRETVILCSDDYSDGDYGRPYLFLAYK